MSHIDSKWFKILAVIQLTTFVYFFCLCVSRKKYIRATCLIVIFIKYTSNIHILTQLCMIFWSWCQFVSILCPICFSVLCQRNRNIRGTYFIKKLLQSNWQINKIFYMHSNWFKLSILIAVTLFVRYFFRVSQKTNY